MKQMKKWSILMLIVMMPLFVMAEDFNETKLFGQWTLYEIGGEYMKNGKISKLIPGSLKFYDEYNALSDDSLGVVFFIDLKYNEHGKVTGYVDRTDGVGIRDYFITGKVSHFLHILFDDSRHALRYRITYSTNEILLETLDNKTWLRMKREVEMSVPTIRKADDCEDKYYNLEGKRIEVPKRGVNIINGKKYLVK